MDKYEYRVKTEQMLENMEKKDYKKAMEIADTIDWRKVKNATMLSNVSEIYEANKEYQKSRDVLFVLYDRSPGSRKIVYRLGTLALKINDIEEASDCYEEFVKIAPKDPNQYILKYKILKAQKAPYDEQIATLEAFKKAEYVEKWAYELALLYHEAGRSAECLEECDDLILWFSDGQYVYQAMELKRHYKPLTPLQQEKYNTYKRGGGVKQHIEAAEAIRTATPAQPKEEKETSEKETVQSLAEEPITEETEETEEVVEAAEAAEKKSAITQVVKGATLGEALANGVKVANGIDMEERSMADKTEGLRITGQMKIEEILQEWEEKQKGNAEAIAKQKEEDEIRLQKERKESEQRREEERQESERKELEEEQLRKAAEEKAFNQAAEETAKREAAEAAAAAEDKTVTDKTVPLMTADIRQLMEELENGTPEPEEMEEVQETEPEDHEPVENMGNVVEDLQLEDDEDDFDDDDMDEEDDFDEEDSEEVFDETDFDDEDDFNENFGSIESEEESEEEDSEEEFEEEDSEEDFEEADFEEEDLEEEDFEEEDLDEEDEEEFLDEEELPEIAEPEEEEELVIEEPSEEEIQKRIKKSKGGGVPFDTGFVVTGRYDLSATSEIGLKAGLTEDQKKLFSYFVPVRGMSEQLVEVLDNDRRAQREGTSKTGNLLVVGRKGSGKTVLAVDIVKAIQKQRNLKQGKVAIVTGESLNKKELSNIVQKLRGGAIIVEKAGKLNSRTIQELDYLMEKKTGELLFVLEDQRKPLERIMTANPNFRKKFTSRLELPVFINDELVTFGQTYAKENGYKLDEMGILALYSRIDVMQREDHAVTVAEVKEIMDEAIEHSQKANVKHLARRVFGKSTDDSDRIILKEEDFKI